MAFQQKTWPGWPWDKTTVLLKDFSTTATPRRDRRRTTPSSVDIALLSQTFETSAGERFFTLMNHELTHVATMDVWNSTDLLAHLLPGQADAAAGSSESILYNFLATPRVNVPRWYLEGSAVFTETWMAGKLWPGPGRL